MTEHRPGSRNSAQPQYRGRGVPLGEMKFHSLHEMNFLSDSVVMSDLRGLEGLGRLILVKVRCAWKSIKIVGCLLPL